MALGRPIHKIGMQGNMPAADLHARMIARYEGTGDSEVRLLAQEMLWVIEPKGQAKNRADRCQRDVALVPGDLHAQHFFALPLPFADHAHIWNGCGIRSCPGAGQCKCGNLQALGQSRQVMVLLGLGAIVHEQLCRTQRVGHHHRHRQRGRPGREFRDHFRMAIGRKAQPTVLLGNDHAQKALVFNKLPGLRRHVVGLVNDLPVVHHTAGLFHLVV